MFHLRDLANCGLSHLNDIVASKVLGPQQATSLLDAVKRHQKTLVLSALTSEPVGSTFL